MNPLLQPHNHCLKQYLINAICRLLYWQCDQLTIAGERKKLVFDGGCRTEDEDEEEEEEEESMFLSGACSNKSHLESVN